MACRDQGIGGLADLVLIKGVVATMRDCVCRSVDSAIALGVGKTKFSAFASMRIVCR
jgi:hypothetical protein